MTYKTERQLKICIGIAFWGGIGLMNLINALQLTMEVQSDMVGLCLGFL
jgi:hypothetical protein